MMNNLFSVFDPMTNILNLSFNWISTILGMFLLPQMFWLIPNRYMMIWYNIIMKLNIEFKNLIKNKNNGIPFIFITLFSLVLFNNFLGLFPYIFTSTSHLVMTLSLTLPLWLSYMIFGWMFNTQHMFSHLIPQGTPKILMPFMVLIETISNLIRPGTLAVRLSANMIAGHLLMTLLSNMGSKISIYLIIFLLIIQIMLMMLEFAVTLIQSYVIAILSNLYSSETN